MTGGPIRLRFHSTVLPAGSHFFQISRSRRITESQAPVQARK